MTINLLQPLRFLDLPPELKRQLVNYRIGAFNRQLQPLVERTHRLLDELRVQEREASVAKGLPGLMGKGGGLGKR